VWTVHLHLLLEENPRGRVALEIPKMARKGVLHKGIMGEASGQVGLHGGAPNLAGHPLVGPP
jgi:hypothetical protein